MISSKESAREMLGLEKVNQVDYVAISVASPDDSLMLLKCTGAVPHVGGQLVKPGEPYYRIIRDWIASGAPIPAGAASPLTPHGEPPRSR